MNTFVFITYHLRCRSSFVSIKFLRRFGYLSFYWQTEHQSKESNGWDLKHLWRSVMLVIFRYFRPNNWRKGYTKWKIQRQRHKQWGASVTGFVGILEAVSRGKVTMSQQIRVVGITSFLNEDPGYVNKGWWKEDEDEIKCLQIMKNVIVLTKDDVYSILELSITVSVILISNRVYCSTDFPSVKVQTNLVLVP